MTEILPSNGSDRSPHVPDVFVSYRRSDSPTVARQVAVALRERFGKDRVFFDTDDLRSGMDWEREVTRRVSRADVLVVVIGQRWAELAEQNGRRRIREPGDEDVVEHEIQTALTYRRHIVPVLVENATMPRQDRLPRPLRAVPEFHGVALGPASWDRDVAALVARLEDLPPTGVDEKQPEESPPLPAPTGRGRPDEDHFRKVARAYGSGAVVAVIGPQVHGPDTDEPWQDGCGRLPSAPELAGILAARFEMAPGVTDLAKVTQRIYLAEGASNLNQAIKTILLDSDCQPSPLHRAFARMASAMHERGRTTFPMIITTNYDTALERAFDDVHEPFDLAVFLATDPHRGKFLHIPWSDRDGAEAQVISEPNTYVDFPMDENAQLNRTLIVKIHGGGMAAAPPPFVMTLRNNFVITEDDYIGYLTNNTVESLVPAQILDKVRNSQLLFMGYDIRDWNLRVFLKRIWIDKRPGENRSWAVERSFDDLEWEFWEKLDVHRIESPLSRYAQQLEQHVRG